MYSAQEMDASNKMNISCSGRKLNNASKINTAFSSKMDAVTKKKAKTSYFDKKWLHNISTKH